MSPFSWTSHSVRFLRTTTYNRKWEMRWPGEHFHSYSAVRVMGRYIAWNARQFMMPEIVDQLAAMLDYNLDALVGPRCNDLRVENKEKYHFNPWQLLSDVVQVYLNLGDQDTFIRAVPGDAPISTKYPF